MALEKMSKISNKLFCESILNACAPAVQKHSHELLRWVRWMAKEIPRLKGEVEKLKGEGNDRIDAMMKLISEKETLEQNQRDLASETIQEREIASQMVRLKDEAEASLGQHKDEV
ncbi:unnamed protein product [Calypogeia fissa]